MSSPRRYGRPLGRRPLVCGAFFLAACCLALGCGGGKGYHVSGTVNFDGKPVPLGKIYFNPDASKGNSGAPGWAEIKDGKFDTAAKGGQGSPGGPVIVRIEGFVEVPPTGDVTTKPLFFPYETPVDLPKATTTKTFDVPASAAKQPPPQKGGGVIVP